MSIQLFTIDFDGNAANGITVGSRLNEYFPVNLQSSLLIHEFLDPHFSALCCVRTRVLLRGDPVTRLSDDYIAQSHLVESQHLPSLCLHFRELSCHLWDFLS